MDLAEAAANLSILPLRLRMIPKTVLELPAFSKGNTLRGAFGSDFPRPVCIPECHDTRPRRLYGTCPYHVIFEPAPTPGADRPFATSFG
jgi:hypothetical protein